eukprot:5504112-Pleurochrysis_carterae.AAC.1
MDHNGEQLTWQVGWRAALEAVHPVIARLASEQARIIASRKKSHQHTHEPEDTSVSRFVSKTATRGSE